MSNKTISINPSLFSLGRSKTKKIRENKTKSTAVPIISPNVLKNKLLKRIKEHKQRETQDLDNNKRNLAQKTDNPKQVKNDEILNFSDEFNDSINYLQTLSKHKRVNDEKKKYEYQKQKQRDELERRTVRNYHSIGGVDIENPKINIDLPEELIQPIIQGPNTEEPFKINTPYKGDNVPYGVLKGGLKPSYREWSRTQRNNIVTNPNSSLIIEGGNLASEKTARENRLNLLKEKIKQKVMSEKTDLLLNENLIKKPIADEILLPPVQNVLPSSQPEINSSGSNQQNIQNNQQNIQNNQTGGEHIIATKHITKKTIKRKYTLGKSDIKRKVAVLIKDRGTRKKVLTAQKDLKRRNINDIKEYLRNHNLIKAGSNAPNDVVRKLYESAMLSGEITNSNSDTLLHNFSKEDKAK
jgi:hypothetical protein